MATTEIKKNFKAAASKKAVAKRGAARRATVKKTAAKKAPAKKAAAPKPLPEAAPTPKPVPDLPVVMKSMRDVLDETAKGDPRTVSHYGDPATHSAVTEVFTSGGFVKLVSGPTGLSILSDGFSHRVPWDAVVDVLRAGVMATTPALPPVIVA